jgi:predicted nucleic acid-binding protein
VRTAIDTNILSSLWSGEPTAQGISIALNEAQGLGGLVISPAVYAELRAYPRVTKEFVDEFLANTNIVVDWVLDDAVWQLVADRFGAYAEQRRAEAGAPKRLLADFIVGAHALLHADRLMTLDHGRYAREFAELKVV